MSSFNLIYSAACQFNQRLLRSITDINPWYYDETHKKFFFGPLHKLAYLGRVDEVNWLLLQEGYEGLYWAAVVGYAQANNKPCWQKIIKTKPELSRFVVRGYALGRHSIKLAKQLSSEHLIDYREAVYGGAIADSDWHEELAPMIRNHNCLIDEYNFGSALANINNSKSDLKNESELTVISRACIGDDRVNSIKNSLIGYAHGGYIKLANQLLVENDEAVFEGACYYLESGYFAQAAVLMTDQVKTQSAEGKLFLYYLAKNSTMLAYPEAITNVKKQALSSDQLDYLTYGAISGLAELGFIEQAKTLLNTKLSTEALPKGKKYFFSSLARQHKINELMQYLAENQSADLVSEALVSLLNNKDYISFNLILNTNVEYINYALSAFQLSNKLSANNLNISLSYASDIVRDKILETIKNRSERKTTDEIVIDKQIFSKLEVIRFNAKKNSSCLRKGYTETQALMLNRSKDLLNLFLTKKNISQTLCVNEDEEITLPEDITLRIMLFLINCKQSVFMLRNIKTILDILSLNIQLKSSL